MQITLAHIGARRNIGTKVRSGSKAGTDPAEAWIQSYLERTSAYARCQSEVFPSVASFREWSVKQQGRTPLCSVLLDSRGKMLSSEAFAEWLGTRRDNGIQHLVLAIGPADGWSEEDRKQATLLLSFGPMTLAHTLARLVAAEQIYRAFTILAGHPYHGGHQ